MDNKVRGQTCKSAFSLTTIYLKHKSTSGVCPKQNKPKWFHSSYRSKRLRSCRWCAYNISLKDTSLCGGRYFLWWAWELVKAKGLVAKRVTVNSILGSELIWVLGDLAIATPIPDIRLISGFSSNQLLQTVKKVPPPLGSNPTGPAFGL